MPFRIQLIQPTQPVAPAEKPVRAPIDYLADFENMWSRLQPSARLKSDPNFVRIFEAAKASAVDSYRNNLAGYSVDGGESAAMASLQPTLQKWEQTLPELENKAQAIDQADINGFWNEQRKGGQVLPLLEKYPRAIIDSRVKTLEERAQEQANKPKTLSFADEAEKEFLRKSFLANSEILSDPAKNADQKEPARVNRNLAKSQLNVLEASLQPSQPVQDNSEPDTDAPNIAPQKSLQALQPSAPKAITEKGGGPLIYMEGSPLSNATRAEADARWAADHSTDNSKPEPKKMTTEIAVEYLKRAKNRADAEKLAEADGYSW
jgi:hypothetical protein